MIANLHFWSVSTEEVVCIETELVPVANLITVKPIRPVVLILLITTISILTSCQSTPASVPAKRVPTNTNIVLIMTDDQDTDSLPVMRNLMSYPEGSWVNFTNAYANHSICCPARATVLTGQ